MSLIESPLQVYGSQERSSASSVSPGALLPFSLVIATAEPKL